jgi:hypothetical protein
MTKLEKIIPRRGAEHVPLIFKCSALSAPLRGRLLYLGSGSAELGIRNGVNMINFNKYGANDEKK